MIVGRQACVCLLPMLDMHMLMSAIFRPASICDCSNRVQDGRPAFEVAVTPTPALHA